MIFEILLFPFKLLMMIAGFILSLFGKLLTILIGLGMIVSGILCCLSIVGFFVGIPLILIGIVTVIKGIF